MMTHPENNTAWAISAKGNQWRRKDGVLLIVGKQKGGKYWARQGDDFLSERFSSLRAAKRALEGEDLDEEDNWYDEDFLANHDFGSGGAK
jgi:hypothetical protein